MLRTVIVFTRTCNLSTHCGVLSRLKQLKNGKYENIGDVGKDLNKNITELMGALNDFKHSCIAKTNENENFICATNTKRLGTLINLLRLENYDEFCKKAKEQRNNKRVC